MASRTIMGDRKHSPYLLETIALSRRVALDMGLPYIDNLSFMLAAVRQEKNGVAVALREKAIELQVLEKLFRHGPAYDTNASLPLTKDFETALMGAGQFAEMYQSEFIEVEHVVCALMQNYDFNSLLLLRAGFDLSVLETSLLKHGLVRQPVLFVPKQNTWQKIKALVSR